MQVVILAGGLGTRLRPFTEHVPKPMVEVGGKPFLEYILRHLARQGLNRFLILTGYLGEEIQKYFGNGDRLGVSIQYVAEPKPLGTAGAIRNAFDFLDSDFLLLYGDSYLPIDYPEVVKEFYKRTSKCLMVIYDNRLGDTDVISNVALYADGTVRTYRKGDPESGLQYVEAGVLCLSRAIFEDLPRLQPISLEQELYGKLISERQIRAFVTKQRFFDIGTPARLQEFMMRKP